MGLNGSNPTSQHLYEPQRIQTHNLWGDEGAESAETPISVQENRAVANPATSRNAKSFIYCAVNAAAPRHSQLQRELLRCDAIRVFMNSDTHGVGDPQPKLSNVGKITHLHACHGSMIAISQIASSETCHRGWDGSAEQYPNTQNSHSTGGPENGESWEPYFCARKQYRNLTKSHEYSPLQKSHGTQQPTPNSGKLRASTHSAWASQSRS